VRTAVGQHCGVIVFRTLQAETLQVGSLSTRPRVSSIGGDEQADRSSWT
jgi:hypothetical protein